MTLAARAKLGPYEIVSVFDSGGMGEVYSESLAQPGKLAQCECTVSGRRAILKLSGQILNFLFADYTSIGLRISSRGKARTFDL